MAKEWKAIGGAGTIGLEVVLSILLGFFAGRWLDSRLHTAPYLAIIGFLFGAAAAVKAIIRTWKQMQEVARREEREQGNPAPLFDKDSDLPEKQRDAPEDWPAPETSDGDAERPPERGRENERE